MSNQVAVLDPVYVEKTCPGSKGHPLSRFYFSEHLYEKKLTPLSKPTALAEALIVENSARACSDCFVLTKLTRLGEPNCSQGEKLARLGG